MDQPKLERLLRLMKMLTANTEYTIDDLAERLMMSRRTVYRYIDTFREAGFVIKKSGEHIRLDKESPHFQDISQLIHFTEEEAVILKSATTARWPTRSSRAGCRASFTTWSERSPKNGR